MDNYLDAKQEIRQRIEDTLENKGLLIQRRNRKIQPNPSDRWGRVTFTNTSSHSAELGQLWLRDRGFITVDIFFPLNTGTGEIDPLAIEIRDTFTEYTYNYLELGVGTINDVPTTLDYFHVHVILPFRHK